MEGFAIISMTLKEMYQMITMGGNAELELVDSLDPFQKVLLLVLCHQKRVGEILQIFLVGKKR